MRKFGKRQPPEKPGCDGTKEYALRYLQPMEIDRRRCVYISQRTHDVITSFLRSIEGKGLTVGGYVDNILTEHLEKHKAEINHLYRRERDDLL